MRYRLTLLACCIGVIIQAQNNTTWRFDLGNGSLAPGYTAVNATTIYNDQTGYGFEPGAALRAVDRHTRDPLRTDCITSDLPFFFSVKLPEGNYQVNLILGDADTASVATVRAECRRMMLQQVSTKKGKFAAVSFTVHVRDSLIAGTGKKLRLKPREHAYLHWDNKLTIEFNDRSPRVCAIEIMPVTAVTTVFLAGNSTVWINPMNLMLPGGK